MSLKISTHKFNSNAHDEADTIAVCWIECRHWRARMLPFSQSINLSSSTLLTKSLIQNKTNKTKRRSLNRSAFRYRKKLNENYFVFVCCRIYRAHPLHALLCAFFSVFIFLSVFRSQPNNWRHTKHIICLFISSVQIIEIIKVVRSVCMPVRWSPGQQRKRCDFRRIIQ